MLENYVECERKKFILWRGVHIDFNTYLHFISQSQMDWLVLVWWYYHSIVAFNIASKTVAIGSYFIIENPSSVYFFSYTVKRKKKITTTKYHISSRSPKQFENNFLPRTHIIYLVYAVVSYSVIRLHSIRARYFKHRSVLQYTLI